MSKNAQQIRSALWDNRNRTEPRNSKTAPCPSTCPNSHEDKNPSFSVSDRSGKILWHCLSGRCSQMEAKQALTDLGLLGGEKPKEPDPVDVAPLPTPEQQKPREWVYRDAKGFAKAVHGRWDTPDGKIIRWRLPEGTYDEGLGSVKIENLPLLNSDLLASKPTVPVVFCEGEAAVDACTAHGLLAVTNGGGANQQKFGTSLEVLRNRKVELWPDNDPPGRILMNVLQDQLKLIADKVQTLNVGKDIPFKGDAVQFFGDLKGTVAELRKFSEPVVEHIDYDRILITYPLELAENRGTISFLFEEISSVKGGLNARITITPPPSAVASENYALSRRINLLSSSNIAAILRETKGAFKGYDWDTIFPRTLSLANQAIFDSEANAPIDLASGMDYAVQEWVVSKMIPLNTNSVIFGAGASMKSIALHSLALHVGIGDNWADHNVEHVNQKILVLDYENNADTWKRQQRRLLDGMGMKNVWPEDRINYLQMRGLPLNQSMQKVEKIVRSKGIKFIIIDSAALAIDGDPVDTGVVTNYFNCLQKLNTLGCTTVTIAHVVKNSSSKENEAGTMTPFGSTFWGNCARATFYVEKEQWEGSINSFTQTWRCRKFNFGYPPPDFSIRVLFEDPEGSIKIERDNGFR